MKPTACLINPGHAELLDNRALLESLENGRIAGAVHLDVMNDLVASYTAWGDVEHTLLTDLPRLLEQFPRLTAVAIFPQFAPETVFNVASRGGFIPAGLTRFVIPGRILRLNMKLDRLLENDTLAPKRTWFKKQIAQKLPLHGSVTMKSQSSFWMNKHHHKLSN